MVVRFAALATLALALIVVARSGHDFVSLQQNCGLEEIGEVNRALGTKFNINGACKGERNSSLNLVLLSSGLVVLSGAVLFSKQS